MHNDLLPLVSVVIPCYNKGSLIESAVGSVFDGTYNNIEVVIINDGSSDPLTIKSLKLLQKKHGVKLISTSNQGVAKARNLGISLSLGKYVVLLDNDDFIGKSFITSGVNYLENNLACPYAYSDYVKFGKKYSMVELGDGEEEISGVPTRVPVTCVYRKSVLREFYFNPDLPCAEDWDLFLQMRSKGFVGKKMPGPALFFYRLSHEGRDLGSVSLFTLRRRRRVYNQIRIANKAFLSKEQRRKLKKIQIRETLYFLARPLLPLYWRYVRNRNLPPRSDMQRISTEVSSSLLGQIVSIWPGSNDVNIR